MFVPDVCDCYVCMKVREGGREIERAPSPAPVCGPAVCGLQAAGSGSFGSCACYKENACHAIQTGAV